MWAFEHALTQMTQNVLKTAQLLANSRSQPLSYDHVTTVMEVTQHLHNSTQASERSKASVYN